MSEVISIGVGSPIKYKGDAANLPGTGAIVAVREPTRFSTRSYDVVLKDGRQINAVIAGNIAGSGSPAAGMTGFCRFEVLDGPLLGAEQLATLQTNAAVVAGQKAADKAAADAQFAAEQEAAKLAGTAMGLVPQALFGALSKKGTAAAYNLRAELKAAGIKVSVKQPRYTTIYVTPAGPLDEADTAKLKAICGKYEAGRFDGMIDGYEYSRGAWGKVFGDTQYVMPMTKSGRLL